MKRLFVIAMMMLMSVGSLVGCSSRDVEVKLTEEQQLQNDELLQQITPEQQEQMRRVQEMQGNLMQQTPETVRQQAPETR